MKLLIGNHRLFALSLPALLASQIFAFQLPTSPSSRAIHTSLSFTQTRTTTSTRRNNVLPPLSMKSSSSNDSSEASKQNLFGVLSDAVTGAAFSVLHAFDDDYGIEDSSKNLRVLWVRALLHQKGLIHDEVAAKLLPPTTRGLVTSDAGANLLDPLVKFTEWIQARTDFIDAALERFLSSPVCTDPDTGEPRECQVVLFGAGYDTRVLRNRHSHDHKVNFIEVDLPSVVEGKTKLYKTFAKKEQEETKTDTPWDMDSTVKLVPFDLNQCGDKEKKSLVETLRTVGGLKRDIPTFFVWEAVLFYVDESAVRNIMKELFDFAQKGGNGDSPNAETLLCFTDSLKPFVDVPFTNEANKFFEKNSMDLLEHRARWGGAVHFALAASKDDKYGPGNIDQQQQQQQQKQRNDSIGSNGPPSSSTKTLSVEDAPVTAKDIKQDASENTVSTATTTPAKQLKKNRVNGKIGRHISKSVGGIVNSYTPTQANNPKLLENPSFENAWYAVGYKWQIDGFENAVEAALYEQHHADQQQPHTKPGSTKPFATRLWGEPIVIYRDVNNKLVAMADVCPHRSAPLSMGTVEDGQLVCFYHGWKFGKEGACEDIPTLSAVEDDGRLATKKRSDEQFKKRVTEANCGNYRAVVEHDGLIYVWRGNILEANTELLPTKRKGDMETVAMDSVLDYSVDYSYIVENNLDSPHLFYLHDGSVPPIEGIGLMNQNLQKLRLQAFKDDCGYGHLGKLGKDGRPKKLIRFDPPNIVRHGGVSGFEEEFHCVPIAPHRTRVLIRQHIPKGPILSTITSIPYMKPALTALVNSWNYHIGLEDAVVMQGQAHRIEDWGAPRMSVGGLGDDLIKRYWKWRSEAHASIKPNEYGVQTPYYTSFEHDGQSKMPSGIPTGTAFGDSAPTMEHVRTDSRLRNAPLVKDDGGIDPATGNPIGSWGIKQNYLQNTPEAKFPPMNYQPYANLLVLDDLVKQLFAGQEPSNTMIKTALDDLDSRDYSDKKTKVKNEKLIPGILATSAILTATNAAFGRSIARAMSSIMPSAENTLLKEKLFAVSLFYQDVIDGLFPK